MCLTRANSKPLVTMKFIGQLYRLFITYIFGLLTTMLLVWLIKITVGRLRPDFIQICRPFENVCPNWYTILQKTRQSIDERNSIESDPRLLDLIVAQLAKQGKYLVTVATTLSPDSKSTGQLSDGLLTNANCMENNILKLKEASLVALLIGINRVIYRDNWFEDILAGWIVGICVAIYVCFKVLYNRDKWNDLTNYDLNRRLHRIQSLIQTHYDYKQSEVN
ncbi:phospholipid phosphatase-related type 5-like [Schistosoma japonicum]|nr:phospholipid phosphatase-related type 5-like [Schistosoma japonicum]